jgi:hypothetical protein
MRKSAFAAGRTNPPLAALRVYRSTRSRSPSCCYFPATIISSIIIYICCCCCCWTIKSAGPGDVTTETRTNPKTAITTEKIR